MQACKLAPTAVHLINSRKESCYFVFVVVCLFWLRYSKTCECPASQVTSVIIFRRLRFPRHNIACVETFFFPKEQNNHCCFLFLWRRRCQIQNTSTQAYFVRLSLWKVPVLCSCDWQIAVFRNKRKRTMHTLYDKQVLQRWLSEWQHILAAFVSFEKNANTTKKDAAFINTSL